MALSLMDQFVEPSPWVWVAFLAVAGLGALGLYLANRSRGLMLLAAYVLWAIAGLIALVPAQILRDEAIACYVLLAIALPLLVIFVRERARWWALIPGGILAVIGLSFLIAGGAAGYSVAFALLVAGAWILVCAFVGRGRSGEAALPGAHEPAPPEPEMGEPPAG